MDINSKYAERFWEGYRAFVFGGREVSFSGRGGKCRVLDSSLEPYADFSDEEKEQWRRGVRYAKNERDECLSISVEDNRDMFKRNAKKLKSLLSAGYKTSEIAREFNVTTVTARTWKRKLASGANCP